MSPEELAHVFQKRHEEVVAFVEECPPESWTSLLPDGERTVAAVAMHIGRAYRLQGKVVAELVAGNPPPAFLDEIDESNARHAERDRDATREEVLALLSEYADEMESCIASLTAGQLETPIQTPAGTGPPLVAVIREAVLGHPTGHLRELQEATGVLD